MGKGKRRKGFTLVELLVVIAIIGILVAIITPNAFRAIERSKIARLEADLHAIKSASLAYYIDVGDWPSQLNDLVDPATPPTGWDGPYLEKLPDKSPWGDYGLTQTEPAGLYGDVDFSLFVSAASVPLSAAQRIDVDLDGVEGASSGAVQYNSTDPTTLYYGIGQQ
ncbi:MAG: prepilin-type N-terminal cleavage/methylation domain-containing protein [Synergistetes bacterium]|uniref:N-terminal methylation n=1 Tax=Thermotoga petrophila TaxID=93929 RepID=A0A101EQ72_9THEM|nr:MAG: N-terminal methylation [Thermotoga petrophila]MBC7331163.1 prepilin-type N-terminal cleavage/methylation domain-containing protein [Synergistota bacterium]